jgi:hypothetical protein
MLVAGGLMAAPGYAETRLHRCVKMSNEIKGAVVLRDLGAARATVLEALMDAGYDKALSDEAVVLIYENTQFTPEDFKGLIFEGCVKENVDKPVAKPAPKPAPKYRSLLDDPEIVALTKAKGK